MLEINCLALAFEQERCRRGSTNRVIQKVLAWRPDERQSSPSHAGALTRFVQSMLTLTRLRCTGIYTFPLPRFTELYWG